MIVAVGPFRARLGIVPHLQIVKDSLECQTNALGAVVGFRRHLVDRLSQHIREVQDLQREQRS